MITYESVTLAIHCEGEFKLRMMMPLKWYSPVQPSIEQGD
jgi:hypothetical protein